MVIFPFRHASSRGLIATAGAMLAIGMVLSWVGGASLESLRLEGPEVLALEESGEELTDEQRLLLERWEQVSMFMKPPEQQVAGRHRRLSGRICRDRPLPRADGCDDAIAVAGEFRLLADWRVNDPRDGAHEARIPVGHPRSGALSSPH